MITPSEEPLPHAPHRLLKLLLTKADRFGACAQVQSQRILNAGPTPLVPLSRCQAGARQTISPSDEGFHRGSSPGSRRRGSAPKQSDADWKGGLQKHVLVEARPD